MSFDPNNPTPVLPVSTHYRSAYSPKLKVPLSFPAESPFTKQEFKDECDVNVILKRYMATGEMPNLNERNPQYIDCTGHDYQAAMNLVAEANTLFAELPSAVRSRFNHDPSQFLDFCSNEANRPELEAMGLLKDRSEWVTAPVEFGAPVATENVAPAEPQ